MNEDPIVAEVRRNRVALVEEAGHDLNRLAVLIQQWVAQAPGTGPVVHNAEELRRIVELHTAAAVVRETPRTYRPD